MGEIVYFPVSTVEELKNLDEKEMVEGYCDGLKNEPAPRGNRSKSYFHGWRNGMIDKGHIKSDHASQQLAHEVIESGYLKNIFSQ